MARARFTSATVPVSTRVAVFAPPTVTPDGVADSDSVPRPASSVTCTARSPVTGSRSASTSETERPGIGNGTSSSPLAGDGRWLTGASLRSTYPASAVPVAPSPSDTTMRPGADPPSLSMRTRRSPTGCG